jgi:Tfp pilus assembly protein PilO
VTLTERDRRIVMILIPIVVLLGYWFLILSPKRNDLKTAQDAQHAAESARDQAVAQANSLEHSRQTFAADYADIVQLGKAIPDTVDAPSLLIQLDRAAHGTHIDFNSVTFGGRSSATVATVTPTTTTQGPPEPNGNAATGGAPAQTGLGGAAETAGNTVTTANQASSSAESNSGTSTTSTSTTTTATAPAATGPSTTSTSLDTVPLTFSFTGSYFDLADFFHRLKRFVYVANNHTFVRGRLISIDTLSFSPAGTGSSGTNQLTAAVGATVYLSPASQGGVTAGATPAGPAGTTTSQTTTTPAASQTSKVPLAAGVR